ncbi:MAG TPA: PfkB family carbohydrate kinase [Acidobacteriota bacterium]|nr:PfkB family carbohydrate kinase [Acidobacteriota bacterium]
MSLVIIGSIAFDTIETPFDRRERIVGGSCSYASLAASYFTDTKIVSVAGEDFPKEMIEAFNQKGIDTRGLVLTKGKTFFWEGRYGEDPNQRTTLKTEINVFRDFKPDLLPEYRKADIVFLGTIDPALQLDVLSQVENPKITAMDTIKLYIDKRHESLLEVIKKVDIFFGNDEEVKKITGESNLIKAGRNLLNLGPSFVVIKKGEHGVIIIENEFISGMLAHPCEDVVDPTGAGDSFAGGFLGYLDKVNSFEEKDIRKAAVYGSVMASFTIEDFGTDRLMSVTGSEIEQRYKEFKNLVSF